MSEISFVQATRHHDGAPRPSVDALDFTVKDGEFVAVVGPSGCGKSTTLRMVTGLEPVTSGDILMDGKSTRTVAPSKRDVAMVFQTYALYPHMSVADNIGFSLKMRGVSKAERLEKIKAVAQQLELSDYLDRRPKALSGGQRQRVAMARAIIREPKAFLMDEPLSNLDAKLRVTTRAKIADLQRELGVTTIYVTHDQTEAMTMADRIVVLKDGKLMQIGEPRELYNNPANIFVAGFLGTPSMNMISVDVSQPTIGNQPFALPEVVRTASTGSTVSVGIRPEYFNPVAQGSADAVVDVVVGYIEDTGSDLFIRSQIVGDPQQRHVTFRCDAALAPTRGDVLSLAVAKHNILYFDDATGEAINY